jgi:hypothetical protein
MLLLSDPLGMSMAERKFVAITTAWGGGDGGVVVVGGRSTRSKGNVGDEKAEEDKDGSLSLGGGKR